MPVVDLSPGDRVLNLLSCLPWTGARARLVPRCPDVFHAYPGDLLDWPLANVRCESAPELPPRQGGLLRVHCPTLAGSGYRTIKVAADSTVVEVKPPSSQSRPQLLSTLTWLRLSPTPQPNVSPTPKIICFTGGQPAWGRGRPR